MLTAISPKLRPPQRREANAGARSRPFSGPLGFSASVMRWLGPRKSGETAFQEDQGVPRKRFKLNRAVALAEWRELCAA